MNQSFKIMIDIIVFIIIYILFFYPKWKKEKTLAINTLMYIYLMGVLYFTLMPIILDLPFCLNHHYIPMNLNAFEDLFMHRGDALRQVILNIIMMVPFGILLPIYKTNKKQKCNILYTVLMTMLFSLFIEIIQTLIHSYSSSDITDIITNTIGGFIGYIIYIIFKPIINKIFKI